jgi:hypothetical protein
MSAGWSAPTDRNTVQARANGRSRWQATLRFRAKVRRLEVAKRLDELRRAQLAQPFDPTGPIPSWISKGAVKTLAAEFKVSEDTIRQDIRVIDSWPDPAPRRKRARVHDPRFAWAREHRRRPLVITARVRLRLAPDVLTQIQARGEVQEVIRRAIDAYLDTGSAHRSHDCALTMLRELEPGTQDRVALMAKRLNKPLAEMLASVLLVALQPTREPTPVTPPATKSPWWDSGVGSQGKDASQGERCGADE